MSSIIPILNPFDSIKHVGPNDNEYWLARELQPILEYDEWRNLNQTIIRARKACANSGREASEHFVEIDKTIDMPKGAKRQIPDYRLTRYACYLIVMNGDPDKPVIAQAQTYFAIQTRRQEVSDQHLLSQAQMFMQAAQLFAEHEERLNRIESQTLDNLRSVVEIREQILDADYYTVFEWDRKQGLRAPLSIRLHWSGEASELSRVRNIEIKQKLENSYPAKRFHKSILQDVCIPRSKTNGQLPLLKD